MTENSHKLAFPDQKAITAFLRTLVPRRGTQVQVAERAAIKYNTLTNWFTDDPPDMSATNLLRIVIAIGAEDELADWLRSHRDRRGAKLGRLRRVSDADEERAAGDGER